MIPTLKKHLPKGYPLPPPEEGEKFQPIFERAFEIHKASHDFSANKTQRSKEGYCEEFGPREGILSPVKGRTKLSKAHYCDCYERAYQEMKDSL